MHFNGAHIAFGTSSSIQQPDQPAMTKQSFISISIELCPFCLSVCFADGWNRSRQSLAPEGNVNSK